jgi:uncharacterized membrane protein
MSEFNLTTYEIIAPSVSAALMIAYQIGWLIEVKYYPHRTLLRDVFEVTRNWVDFIREDIGKNAILAVQTARNGISASTFFATISSSIAFIILPLTANVSPFLRIKYLILAAFLTMSFVNNGIVIRNYKHVSWIIAAPCRDGSAAESKGVHMHEQKVREISCHLLKRASLHWNIGLRCFYFAIQTAAWALDPTAVIIVTVVLIILLIFTDHPF